MVHLGKYTNSMDQKRELNNWNPYLAGSSQFVSIVCDHHLQAIIRPFGRETRPVRARTNHTLIFQFPAYLEPLAARQANISW